MPGAPAPGPVGQHARMSPLAADNPFAAPSDLPFAVPPFDRIRVEHYAPAFEAGMAEHLAEVDALLAADLDAAAFLDAL